MSTLRAMGQWALVALAAAWCGCNSISLGTSLCASSGGTCQAFPTGCPCGQWNPNVPCGGNLGCCMPQSCPGSDMGPHACLAEGAPCARNADCCSNDCPELGGARSVCSSGGGGGGGSGGPDQCTSAGGRCVVDPNIDCSRGHIGTELCGSTPGAGVHAACCLPGTQAVQCGTMTCGVNQVCVQPCSLTPKAACVDLPASCDVGSSANVCDCFTGADPCGAGKCNGNTMPGVVACWCQPSACDAASVNAFVAAHKSCLSDQDCVPLCKLGATCDFRSVNQAGAAAFPSTFATCTFPSCAASCLPARCDATGSCT
jgi:hypothetical protein